MNETIQGSNDTAGDPGVRIGFGQPPSVFPVYLATGHGRERTASVLLLGNLAGGYLLRTVVVDASGACSWDDATPFEPGTDPQLAIKPMGPASAPVLN